RVDLVHPKTTLDEGPVELWVTTYRGKFRLKVLLVHIGIAAATPSGTPKCRNPARTASIRSHCPGSAMRAAMRDSPEVARGARYPPKLQPASAIRAGSIPGNVMAKSTTARTTVSQSGRIGTLPSIRTRP